MTEIQKLVSLKRQIFEEPAVPIETAAQLCGISHRTLRRHLHLFESRRGRNRHLYITLRSIEKFLVREQYAPTREFDITQPPK
jgi:hypothetical protein